MAISLHPGSSSLFTDSHTDLNSQLTLSLAYNISARTTQKTALLLLYLNYCIIKNVLSSNGKVFTEPLPRNA
jgi:hypothetical protein